jgi:hypothetical protein
MSDAKTKDGAFLLKHWEGFRTEMNDNIGRYVELERYALFSTAAIWGWLAGIDSTTWDPVLKWLPFLINVFFAARGISLVARTLEIGRYLQAAEVYFSVPTALALEQQYKPCSLKMTTVWLFWPLLLIATGLLPFLYDVPPE